VRRKRGSCGSSQGKQDGRSVLWIGRKCSSKGSSQGKQDGRSVLWIERKCSSKGSSQEKQKVVQLCPWASCIHADALQHNPSQILFIGIDVTNEADLKRAKEEAERTAKEKSTFLASISHEIRTPLHCIVGYMQLLQVWLVQQFPMQSG
jgi:K+-sensing histidine kinase KdpD